MNQFIYKILHPQRKQLIYFCFFISPIIIVYLYDISFAWFIGIESILEFNYIILFLFLIATWNNDRVYKTKLKSYMVLTLIFLTLFVVLSYPTRDFLISKTENQVVKLSKKVEEYKKMNGVYPSTFENDFFKNLCLRSYLGTKFYIVKKDTNCFIKYTSFYGYIGSYNLRTKQLLYLD